MTESNAYSTVEAAIAYIAANVPNQPSLDDIAAHVHMSPTHFHKVFTGWAGITPKTFLQYLTVESLKSALISHSSISNASDHVGLSSPSRAYDHFVKIEAMTPGQFATMGRNLTIRYGIHPTPFGDCLIAITDRGICHLSFVLGDADAAIARLKNMWPSADVREHADATKPMVDRIFGNEDSGKPMKVMLKGTPFQIKVWEALLTIPAGHLTTYGGIAEQIGHPKANRAVGSAVGDNPIAYLIPCHRVIRREGNIGNYYYGSTMKTAMIGWERMRSDDHAADVVGQAG